MTVQLASQQRAAEPPRDSGRSEFGAGLPAKLTAVAAIVFGVAIALLLAIEIPRGRAAAAKHLQTLAAVLAANSAIAVENQDRVIGVQVLASLRDEPEIEQTLLMGPDGRIVASFSVAGHIESDGVLGGRDGWLQSALLRPQGALRYSDLVRVEVISPIVRDGQLLGHVYMAANLREFSNTLLLTLGVWLSFAILAVGLVGWWAHRAQRRFALPLDALSRAVRSDAPAPCVLQTSAEIDAATLQLATDFNALVARIAERDSERDRQHRQLREQLADRTRDGTAANNQVRELSARSAELEQALTQLERSRSAHAARLRRELSTSLLGSVASSDLLLDPRAEGASRRVVELAQLGVDSLLTMMNDAAEEARSEVARGGGESIEFDLGRVVEETARLYLKRAHDRNLEFSIDIDPNLRSMLRGDPYRWRQICMNLVSNAVKFTTRGAVNVRLKMLGQRQGICGLRLEVCDTGIGVRSENRAALFELPSVVEAASMTRPRSSAGIGLAVTRLLVGAMGGQVQIDSEFGRGTTVTVDVTLPLGAERGDSRVSPRAAGRRVLIVDDQAVNRERLQRQFVAAGYDVALAVDGEDALRQLAAAAGKDFDLLCVDWQMPGWDGIETIRRVRGKPNGRSLPAILMDSAAHEARDAVLAELAPCARLVKPPSDTALRATADSLLATAARNANAERELTSRAVVQLLSGGKS